MALNRRATSLLPLSAALVVACAHRLTPPTVASAAGPEAAALTIERVRCIATVKSEAIRCESRGSSANARLIASHVAYNRATAELSFDVSVTNGIAQKLGTVNGTTGHPEGVRVTFEGSPKSTAGTGVVSIANPDGVESNGSGYASYYRYAGSSLGSDEMLAKGEASSKKSWIVNVPATVDAFELDVRVTAPVQHPGGYIEIAPSAEGASSVTAGEVRATLRDALGQPSSERVEWTSTNDAVATIGARDGIVTAVGAGEVVISARTSSKEEVRISLGVCPAPSTRAFAAASASLSTSCESTRLWAGDVQTYVRPAVTEEAIDELASPAPANQEGDAVAAPRGDDQRLRWYPERSASRENMLAVAAMQTPDSAFAVSKAGVGLFRLNVDAGALFGGVYDGDASGTGIPSEGAGTRMMWYPRKGAFRAGGIAGTHWDAANIGDYSVAIGQDVRASASNAVAFGLRSTAAQQSSFAVGEDNTASGAASVALGYHAHTNARQGSFVFSDRSSVDTLRAGVNHSANWRVSGGFRIFTASNLSTGVTIQSGASVSNWGQSSAVISTSTGALLSTGGVWTNASDVNRKHQFADVSGDEIIERLRSLPIMTWSYKTEDSTVRHIGPTAQDFLRTFGFGRDSTTIGTVDPDGISFAAIKALDARSMKHEKSMLELRAENDSLRAEVKSLADRLARIEAALNRVPR